MLRRAMTMSLRLSRLIILTALALALRELSQAMTVGDHRWT